MAPKAGRKTLVAENIYTLKNFLSFYGNILFVIIKLSFNQSKFDRYLKETVGLETAFFIFAT